MTARTISKKHLSIPINRWYQYPGPRAVAEQGSKTPRVHHLAQDMLQQLPTARYIHPSAIARSVLGSTVPAQQCRCSLRAGRNSRPEVRPYASNQHQPKTSMRPQGIRSCVTAKVSIVPDLITRLDYRTACSTVVPRYASSTHGTLASAVVCYRSPAQALTQCKRIEVP